MLLRYLLLLCLVLVWREECRASAAVISIDFSSEWLKIALVKVSVYMKVFSSHTFLTAWSPHGDSLK